MIDIIYNKIINSFDDDTHLIINADDPIVSRVKLTHKGKITTYGVGEMDLDYKNPLSYTIDSSYCPNCNSKLKYNYYHYGHIGNYECPNCDFKRGILWEKSTVKQQFQIIFGGIFNYKWLLPFFPGGNKIFFEELCYFLKMKTALVL